MRRGKIVATILILLLTETVLSLSSGNQGASTSLLTHAEAQTPPTPQLAQWKELWGDFDGGECAYSDLGEWFGAKVYVPPNAQSGSHGYIVIFSTGAQVNALDNGYQIKEAFFVFLVNDTEDAAISFFRTKTIGLGDQITSGKFSWTIGDFRIATELFPKEFDWTILASAFWPHQFKKFDIDFPKGSIPRVTPTITGTKRDDYVRIEAQSIWPEQKQVTDKTKTPSTWNEYRYLGGHFVCTAERYKTVTILSVGLSCALTNWELSDVIAKGKFKDSLLNVEEDKQHDQARSVVDRRVRLLVPKIEQWPVRYKVESGMYDAPLDVNVSVLEKLPPGGEEGLKNDNRFKTWTMQTPKRPVTISLRMFKYDADGPIPEKHEDLVKAFPSMYPNPFQLYVVDGKGCLQFDFSGQNYVLTPKPYDTGSQSWVIVDLQNSEMVLPWTRQLTSNWVDSHWLTLDYGVLSDLLFKSITRSGVNNEFRVGNVGAVIQAVATYQNKTGHLLELARSTRQKMKVTEVAEVVGTSQSQTSWGVMIKQLGYPAKETTGKYVYPDGEGTVVKQFSSVEPLKNMGVLTTRLPLQTNDAVLLGRHDEISVWFPLAKQLCVVRSNPDNMNGKDTTSFMICAKGDPTGKGWGEWLVINGICLVLAAGTSAGLGLKFAAEKFGARFLVGLGSSIASSAERYEVTQWVSDYFKEQVIWVTYKPTGTLIAFDVGQATQIYMLEGQALFTHVNTNRTLTLTQGQMTRIGGLYATFSPPGKFDAGSLPPSIQSMLTTGPTTPTPTPTAPTPTPTPTRPTPTPTTPSPTSIGPSTPLIPFFTPSPFNPDAVLLSERLNILMEMLPAAFIVVAASIYLFRKRRRKATTASGQVPSAPPPTPPPTQTDGTVFCTNCGAKISSQARFCPHCGHQR